MLKRQYRWLPETIDDRSKWPTTNEELLIFDKDSLLKNANAQVYLRCCCIRKIISMAIAYHNLSKARSLIPDPSSLFLVPNFSFFSKTAKGMGNSAQSFSVRKNTKWRRRSLVFIAISYESFCRYLRDI